MDFNDFHNWVFRRYNLDLLSYKQEQLNRRINSLMQRIGVKSLDEYKKILEQDREQELKFLDFITINVTEFFRNPDLFKDLECVLKKELEGNNRTLKIWSAACSLGCEPYSIGIILDKISPGKKHNIIATDIDDNILAKAKVGCFEHEEVKNISKEDLNKYFTIKDGKYYINNNIKQMVTFKKHDLIVGAYDKEYDLIICRNVVIYFKNEVKKKIYSKFYDSLKKDGLLFVGATESIYDYKSYGFDKATTFIYKKV